MSALTSFRGAYAFGAGTFFGIVIGNVPGITFKSELDIGDAAMLSVTLVVATLIPSILARQTERRAASSAVIAAQTESVIEYVDSIHRRITSSEIAPIDEAACKDVLASVRRLNNAVERLCRTIAPRDPEGASRLGRAFREFKQSFSRHGFPAQGSRLYSASAKTLQTVDICADDILREIDGIRLSPPVN